MEDSEENLAFASAMEYSEESGSFFKSPNDLKQQLLLYKPPVVSSQDDQTAYGEVVVSSSNSGASLNSSGLPIVLSTANASSGLNSIPLLERIQQQKRQQPDAALGTLRPGGMLLTPPPAHAFGTRSTSHISDLSTSGERNTTLNDYMNSSHRAAVAIPTEMNTSFLQHDSPVFSTPEHHSFGTSSIHIPTYRPNNSNIQQADYKSQIYKAMSQAGRVATSTGYQLYQHVTTFFQDHSSSETPLTRRKTHEMDYQRQSLLLDPHEDKELYDDPERTLLGGGNISDSLVLDESTMNRQVDIHRKRQFQWQKQLRLGRDGEEEEGGGGRNWTRDIVQCVSELKDLYMTAPLHIQVGTIGVGILIVWLLFS